MGICVNHAKITCFGMALCLGPSCLGGVGLGRAKREVLC